MVVAGCLNHMNGSPTKAVVATSRANDLLLRYLQSRDEEACLVLESQLLCEEAAPIIRTVLKQKLRRAPAPAEDNWFAQNLEDIYGTAVLEVLMRLRELKRNDNGAVIDNFHGYVAAITYRVWSECLRKNEPWRASLKKKLHYLLIREQSFSMWKDGDGLWSCGLTAWTAQKSESTNAAQRALLDAHLMFGYGLPQPQGLDNKHLVELVTAIFNFVKCPIRFDDLVRTVVSLYGIDHRASRVERLGDADIPDSQTNIVEEVERRILLRYIWTEIGKLPLRQRMALLLNLTDPLGRSVIALLPATGIASLREIAEVLGMSEEGLANIWYDLPLDDRTIGGYLGATRQQIINLRKTARERLARRSRAFRSLD